MTLLPTETEPKMKLSRKALIQLQTTVQSEIERLRTYLAFREPVVSQLILNGECNGALVLSMEIDDARHYLSRLLAIDLSQRESAHSR